MLKRRNTVLGAGRYGKAADMWSLGIILYVLLSGTHPFHDNTLYEQVSASHTILTSCNLVHSTVCQCMYFTNYAMQIVDSIHLFLLVNSNSSLAYVSSNAASD